MVGVLVWAATASNRRIEIERDAEHHYTERCAGLAGNGVRYKGPFVRLSIYREFLVLSHLQTYVLPFDRIDSVEVESGLVGKGLRIVHSKAGVGAVRLSVANPEKVRDLLISTISDARESESAESSSKNNGA